MSSPSNENDSPDPLINNEGPKPSLEPASGHGQITLVLFRRRALGEQSGAEQRIAARVRKSRQMEAARDGRGRSAVNRARFFAL